jgi:hypothetical protein
MKCYVDPGDFEQYLIPLPAGQRFGKKRDSYIRGQLERRHPRFSSFCCYDARYCFSDKQPGVSAVVMDKTVLARYRVQFPGKPLTVKTSAAGGGKKDRTVFRQRSIAVPALITPVVFSAVLLGIFQPQTWNAPQMALTGAQGGYQTNGLSPDSAEAQTAVEPSAFLREIFAAVAGSDRSGQAKITGFDFSRQKRGESLSMEIAGVFPESLKAITPEYSNLSPVVYREGVPVFSLTLSSGGKGATLGKEELPGTMQYQEMPVIPALRELVGRSGGVMIQENQETGEIRFRLGKTKLKSFLGEVENLRTSSDGDIRRFSLADGGNQAGDLEVALILIPGQPSGTFGFGPFVEFAALFIGPEQRPQITTKVNRSLPAAYSKIGEIQQGGKTCVFYRTPDGKIVRIDE